MALEEISIINTNGEEINISNIVNQMIDFYEMKLEVGETRITDFSEGSEIRNQLEAFAIGIYAYLEEQHESTQIAFISTSYGTWLDKIGELPFINLPRIHEEYSHGTVIFTLASAQTEEYVIPSDTVVSDDETGLEFVTTTDCIIEVGELTGEAEVEAIVGGADGNVASNSINTIVSEYLNTELLSVTNPNPLEEGADEEEDDDYRERLLNNVRSDGFGSLHYYINLCESVEGVHDVILVDEEGYTAKAIVNGDVKPTPNNVLLNVLIELTDLTKKVLSHNFIVNKPEYTIIDLDITIDVVDEIDSAKLENVIRAFFDGGSPVPSYELDGLNINQSVTRDDIASQFLIFENYINATSILVNGEEMTSVEPSENGVLKLDSVNFTQNEV